MAVTRLNIHTQTRFLKDLDVQTNKLKNVKPATQAGEAVVFEQLSQVMESGSKFLKLPVKVATTRPYAATYNATGMTLTASANGAAAFDSINLIVGERVLIKDQGKKLSQSDPDVTGSKIHNGIYTVTDAGSTVTPWVLTRAADCNADNKIELGVFVKCTDGYVNQGQEFQLMGTPVSGNTSLMEIDIDELIFERTSGLGMVTIGSGLSATSDDILSVLAEPNMGINVTPYGIGVNIQTFVEKFWDTRAMTSTANAAIYRATKAIAKGAHVMINGITQRSGSYTYAYDGDDLVVTFSESLYGDDVVEISCFFRA